MSELDVLVAWLKEVSAIAVALTAIFTLLALVHVKALKPLFVKLVHLRAQMRDFLARVNATMAVVTKELTPNGGSSIRDVITSMASRFEQADARVHALMQGHPTPLWESDVKGELVFVSRSTCRLFNRSADELLGHNWLTLVHADMRDAVKQKWESAVNDCREFHEVITFIVYDRSLKIMMDAYVKRHGAAAYGHVGSMYVVAA